MKCLVILAFTAALSLTPTSATAEIQVVVDGTTITALGTPQEAGNPTTFLAVSWPDQPWIPKLETVFETVKAEKTGDAVLTWPDAGEIPFRTIVVAVNASNGSFGIGAPDGFPAIDEELFPAAFVVNEETGKIDAIRLHGRRFEYLVIRPGVGTWRLSTRDGSPSDIDGESDRIVVAAVSSAQANKVFGPPPAWLVSGDLVIAIDARTMSVIAGGV